MRLTFISFAILFTCLLFSISCSKKDNPTTPCDNKGTICFNNKTDSLVTVSIKEAPATITIEPNVIKCLTIKGDVLYSINISGRKLNKDTTLVLETCDKKDVVILR